MSLKWFLIATCLCFSVEIEAVRHVRKQCVGQNCPLSNDFTAMPASLGGNLITPQALESPLIIDPGVYSKMVDAHEIGASVISPNVVLGRTTHPPEVDGKGFVTPDMEDDEESADFISSSTEDAGVATSPDMTQDQGGDGHEEEQTTASAEASASALSSEEPTPNTAGASADEASYAESSASLSSAVQQLTANAVHQANDLGISVPHEVDVNVQAEETRLQTEEVTQKLQVKLEQLAEDQQTFMNSQRKELDERAQDAQKSVEALRTEYAFKTDALSQKEAALERFQHVLQQQLLDMKQHITADRESLQKQQHQFEQQKTDFQQREKAEDDREALENQKEVEEAKREKADDQLHAQLVDRLQKVEDRVSEHTGVIIEAEKHITVLSGLLVTLKQQLNGNMAHDTAIQNQIVETAARLQQLEAAKNTHAVENLPCPATPECPPGTRSQIAGYHPKSHCPLHVCVFKELGDQRPVVEQQPSGEHLLAQAEHQVHRGKEMYSAAVNLRDEGKPASALLDAELAHAALGQGEGLAFQANHVLTDKLTQNAASEVANHAAQLLSFDDRLQRDLPVNSPADIPQPNTDVSTNAVGQRDLTAAQNIITRAHGMAAEATLSSDVVQTAKAAELLGKGQELAVKAQTELDDVTLKSTAENLIDSASEELHSLEHELNQQGIDADVDGGVASASSSSSSIDVDTVNTEADAAANAFKARAQAINDHLQAATFKTKEASLAVGEANHLTSQGQLSEAGEAVIRAQTLGEDAEKEAVKASKEALQLFGSPVQAEAKADYQQAQKLKIENVELENEASGLSSEITVERHEDDCPSCVAGDVDQLIVRVTDVETKKDEAMSTSDSAERDHLVTEAESAAVVVSREAHTMLATHAAQTNEDMKTKLLDVSHRSGDVLSWVKEHRPWPSSSGEMTADDMDQPTLSQDTSAEIQAEENSLAAIKASAAEHASLASNLLLQAASAQEKGQDVIAASLAFEAAAEATIASEQVSDAEKVAEGLSGSMDSTEFSQYEASLDELHDKVGDIVSQAKDLTHNIVADAASSSSAVNSESESGSLSTYGDGVRLTELASSTLESATQHKVEAYHELTEVQQEGGSDHDADMETQLAGAKKKALMASIEASIARDEAEAALKVLPSGQDERADNISSAATLLQHEAEQIQIDVERKQSQISSSSSSSDEAPMGLTSSDEDSASSSSQSQDTSDSTDLSVTPYVDDAQASVAAEAARADLKAAAAQQTLNSAVRREQHGDAAGAVSDASEALEAASLASNIASQALQDGHDLLRNPQVTKDTELAGAVREDVSLAAHTMQQGHQIEQEAQRIAHEGGVASSSDSSEPGSLSSTNVLTLEASVAAEAAAAAALESRASAALHTAEALERDGLHSQAQSLAESAVALAANASSEASQTQSDGSTLEHEVTSTHQSLADELHKQIAEAAHVQQQAEETQSAAQNFLTSPHTSDTAAGAIENTEQKALQLITRAEDELSQAEQDQAAHKLGAAVSEASTAHALAESGADLAIEAHFNAEALEEKTSGEQLAQAKELSVAASEAAETAAAVAQKAEIVGAEAAVTPSDTSGSSDNSTENAATASSSSSDDGEARFREIQQRLYKLRKQDTKSLVKRLPGDLKRVALEEKRANNELTTASEGLVRGDEEYAAVIAHVAEKLATKALRHASSIKHDAQRLEQTVRDPNTQLHLKQQAQQAQRVELKAKQVAHKALALSHMNAGEDDGEGYADPQQEERKEAQQLHDIDAADPDNEPSSDYSEMRFRSIRNDRQQTNDNIDIDGHIQHRHTTPVAFSTQPPHTASPTPTFQKGIKNLLKNIYVMRNRVQWGLDDDN